MVGRTLSSLLFARNLLIVLFFLQIKRSNRSRMHHLVWWNWVNDSCHVVGFVTGYKRCKRCRFLFFPLFFSSFCLSLSLSCCTPLCENIHFLCWERRRSKKKTITAKVWKKFDWPISSFNSLLIFAGRKRVVCLQQ